MIILIRNGLVRIIKDCKAFKGLMQAWGLSYKALRPFKKAFHGLLSIAVHKIKGCADSGLLLPKTQGHMPVAYIGMCSVCKYT